MTMDNGRAELARRLNRIFITSADSPGPPVDPDTLLRFADDILAADYSDPAYGERLGDGGPAGTFVAESGVKAGGVECPMCGGIGRIFDISSAIAEAQAAGAVLLPLRTRDLRGVGDAD